LVISKRIFAVSERHQKIYDTIQKGDILVFYVKPKRLGGIFKVIHKLENLCEGWGEYVHQIEIKPIKVLTNLVELDSQFINKLDLFQKKLWGPTLKGKALIQITKEDFNKLEYLF
jgi:predicted RNA-binding protein